MALFLYIILMGTIVLGTVIRPAIAIGAILCMFGIEQWAQSAGIGVLIRYSYLTNVFCGLIVAVGLIRVFLSGDIRLPMFPLPTRLVFALLAYATLSVFWTSNPDTTFSGQLLSWLRLTVIVFAAPLLIQKPQDIVVALLSIMFTGFLCLAMVQLSGGWSIRGLELSTGAAGAYGTMSSSTNPLALASVGGYIAVIAALLNFQNAGGWLWKIGRWVIVAVGLAVAIRTGSRGQVMAFFIVVVMFLPFSRRMASITGFIGIIMGVVVIGLLGMWIFGLVADTERWEWSAMTEAYQSGRLAGSKLVLSHWLRQSPLAWFFGIGMTGCIGPNLLIIYPHVVAVEVLVEEGIIGFILWSTIIMVTLRKFWRCHQLVSEDRFWRSALATSAALFMYAFILSFKQGNLFGNMHTFTFALILIRFVMTVYSTQSQLASYAAEASL